MDVEDNLFAVLTISDSCFNKSSEDFSGPCLVNLVQETFRTSDILTEIIPDDKIIIEQALCKYSDYHRAQAIFTTGGTGFSPRDFTPEATRSIVHKECPQLALAMALESFKQTPFAALSRAACGIRDRTLIINFPGSVKAVRECFEAIKTILPHAIQLIWDDLKLVRKLHSEIQSQESSLSTVTRHICPHKTGVNDGVDRNSPYPMLPVRVAIEIIFSTVKSNPEFLKFLNNYESQVNIPPFRASVKDGYALKSGFSGVKKIVGYISAGDKINMYDLKDDECFKINTGAPLPASADCVVQVEDTKLLKTKSNGQEELVEILVEPHPFLDIRPIGCDLKKGAKLFPTPDISNVVIKSVMASIGQKFTPYIPKIGIISTGSELLDPSKNIVSEGKIYDSNTTMLEEILKYFGFECAVKTVVTDEYDSVQKSITDLMNNVEFIICTGGVSMGDKDYIKPVLKDLGFRIHFGRVNMKPGKPMTFASLDEKYFFGLPGNPVSAFVTFHLFALPAIRWASGWERSKCELAMISVKLENEKIPLDPRPEYVRASLKCKNGQLYASVTGNQMSSRLQSIVGADALLHLPGKGEKREFVLRNELLNASILRYDFISKYE